MRYRLKLILVIILFSFNSWAQSPIPTDSSMFEKHDANIWDSNAISRIADIGKLWGVIKYFHPEILKGSFDPDQLVLHNIHSLLISPTKQNYLVAINGILAMLHDPGSRILANKASGGEYHYQPSASSFDTKDGSYLALSQSLFSKRATLDSFLTAPVLKKQRIIIDLRNSSSNDELGLKQYQSLVQPLIAAVVSKTLVLPTIRTVYYHAMLRQDFPDDLDVIPSSEREGDQNYWYQERFGYKNTSQGAYVLSRPKPLYGNKKFCFIVNRFDNPNTLKALLALRNRNGCYLIFDGPVPDYLSGDYYQMNLSDNITLKVKVAERVYEDGTAGSEPDLIVNHLSQTELIQKAGLLFRKPAFPIVKRPLNSVVIRLPQKAYAESLYPQMDLRVLGLFNFWNVINYFCPNKKLISGSWDEALTYFIPRFIFAQDYKAYYWQLREMLSRLNDGHAEVTLNYSIVPPQGINDFYTPFCVEYLEGKTVIVSLVKNPLLSVQTEQLKVGDIITEMDGVPINRLYHSWAKYMDSTNDANYYRVLHKVQLVSRAGSQPFKIKFVRNKEEHEVEITPVSADVYFKEFSKVYYPLVSKPFWSVINDSTGYIRVNSIYSNQVDSVWQALKNQKYIIIDARGYPKDDDIVKTIASPFMTKTDTVCINAFPEVTHPLASRNAITLEPETVSPISSKIKTEISKGKRFIILCASGNGSQAETNIISWQKVLNAITIGTQTVGANGVSNTVLLPGGYAGHYSGFAVYYPDGTPNQESGVKIDVSVTPTIAGELQGKDEILERAIEYIKRIPAVRPLKKSQ